MTIHPDVSGRPHALLMHERIIEHINKHEGVRWVTMAEVNLKLAYSNFRSEGANCSNRCVITSRARTRQFPMH